MVNIELLKNRIKDSGMTITAICDKSGILRQTLYRRFSNPNFTIDEIDALTKTLHISQRDITKIFFAKRAI